VLEHHIQKAIIYRLAFSSGLRFSELKPADLDNKLFDYHLKLVIRDGLVEKDKKGLYRLTSEGRRVGVGVLEKQLATLDRAHSVVFLIIRRQSDKAWLLFKRKTHPLLGEVGLMHINPVAGKEIIKTAQDELRESTGLTTSFTYAGNGYFTVLKDGELESFTHFTVLAANGVQGGIKQASQKGEYFWATDLGETKDNLLPTALEIIEQYQTGKPFFIDKTFNL
jgi:hypothetical protein